MPTELNRITLTVDVDSNLWLGVWDRLRFLQDEFTQMHCPRVGLTSEQIEREELVTDPEAAQEVIRTLSCREFSLSEASYAVQELQRAGIVFLRQRR
jgi:hypothetical protein